MYIHAFLAGIGIAMLWVMGMFLVPLIICIAGMFLFDIAEDTSLIVFWISWILYLVLSAVLLIII